MDKRRNTSTSRIVGNTATNRKSHIKHSNINMNKRRNTSQALHTSQGHMPG